MNPQNSQQALSNLQATQAASQDPNTILSNQRQQLGVNAAQDTVTGLRGAINNTTKLLQQVAPSVMGRTGNSLVTNAQANRIIQNEQAPISQNLENQGTKYNQAGEDLSKLEQQAATSAQGLYTGQQDKLSYAQNLYNTLYQKEQDAAAAAFQQQQLAEQKRQFDAQQATAAKAASGSSSAGLGSAISSLLGRGSSAPGNTAKAASTTISPALANQVKTMLSHDMGSIKNEFNAIATSASYGNQNDVLKLKLLYDLNPGLFNGRTGALKMIGL